jgi:lactate dehydrogenase-like 2-hydroxyacid dehydrogenase
MGAKAKMLVIGAVPSELSEALAAYFDLDEHVLEGASPRPIEEIAGGYRALLTRAVCGAPAAVLAAQPELDLILSLGAGLDRFDLDMIGQRGIRLVNTPDSMTEDVADHVIGLVYALKRQLLAGDQLVRSGAWGTTPFALTRRVAGRPIGIVGLGKIGRRIAEKAAALDMPIHYHSRSHRPDLDYSYHDDVVGLAEAVDVLVLACAVTEETLGLIDARVLQALGPDGLLINVARGSVVDESALLTALETGAIRGAALDVFMSEPVVDPRFRTLTNTILSPHAAALTVEARAAAIAHLTAAGRDYALGRDPHPPMAAAGTRV